MKYPRSTLFLITHLIITHKKIPIKDFFSKCDQMRRKLHLLKKSLMETLVFFAVIQLKESRRIHDFMYHHDNPPDASYWHTSDLKAHTKEKKGQ